jgi:hypothetical protein
MATGQVVTERCLLCGRELPRGGFSARVADILLSPLCVECERRCSREPHSVLAEYPQLFEERELINRPVPLTRVPQSASYANPSGAVPQHVIVTDIRMPFESLVAFMVKWAIASIPALIILFLLGVVMVGIFGMMIAAMGLGPELMRGF